jgi:hypothetical protein
MQELDTEGGCVVAAQHAALPTDMGPHPWAPRCVGVQGVSSSHKDIVCEWLLLHHNTHSSGPDHVLWCD